MYYRSLDESIEVHGLLCPITVLRLRNNRYRIIDGNQRYSSVKDETIRCTVYVKRDGQYLLTDRDLMVPKKLISPRKR